MCSAESCARCCRPSAAATASRRALNGLPSSPVCSSHCFILLFLAHCARLVLLSLIHHLFFFFCVCVFSFLIIMSSSQSCLFAVKGVKQLVAAKCFFMFQDAFNCHSPRCVGSVFILFFSHQDDLAMSISIQFQ